MGIRKVFLLSIALGSAVGAVAALLFALQQWSAFQSACGAQRDTRLLVSALRLPEMMNMERAFMNARLVASAIATPEQMAPVMQQVGLVDTALSTARDLTEIPADTAALDAVRKRLVAIRQTGLAAVAKPAADRAAGLVDTYLRQMFAVQGAAYDLANMINGRINASNPSVGQATRLALLAWDLRDWSGRQTTTLISYIGRHLPMADEQAETLAVYKGRLDQKWEAAHMFAAAVNSPDVTATMAEVEHSFWTGGGEAYSTWVVPNRGRTLELDLDAFVTRIRPILDAILPLRDRALKEALRQCDADIVMRRVRFLLSFGLLLVTACAAAAATTWFDRRVVRPVEQITTVILALASGVRDMRIPLTGRTDELGQMAMAIEALRCNALQAEMLSREVLALQQARAEEKSRLLTELTQRNRELAELNLELESLATTDALTGVPNRRSFDLVLAREWRRAQRDETSLGLLLLDIDYFKTFNDRYGHPAGDACLASVASAVMKASQRPGDVTARYGGEEFAVILPSTDLESAVELAERVRQAVLALDMRHVGNPARVVTVSVGVSAIIPHAASTIEMLIRDADAALYVAKHAGRNQVAVGSRSDLVLQCADS